jgi:hypothetical protein
MSELTMEALARRVERLERETRWWKRVTGLGLVLVVAAGLLGQAAPLGLQKAVDAERFNLRDAAGQLRAVLGSSADGATSLLLYNVAGVHHARRLRERLPRQSRRAHRDRAHPLPRRHAQPRDSGSGGQDASPPRGGLRRRPVRLFPGHGWEQYLEGAVGEGIHWRCTFASLGTPP